MTIPTTAPGLREEAEAALWSLEVDTGLDELGFSVATVGSEEGRAEGCEVGLEVGWQDGCIVGSSVGCEVG